MKDKIAGYEVRIGELKKGLEEANRLRIQAAARLEELLRQEREILEQLSGLGVNPEDLDREIARLEGEIEALIKEVESLIPWELLEEERRGKNQGSHT